MRTTLTRSIALLSLSTLYWLLVGGLSGVAEPWDAAAYWRLWYPMSLVLAAAAGPFFGRRGWLAGTVMIFAQAPVMWANTGVGALWMVGPAMLFVLASPAAAISALTGWLAVRRGAADRVGSDSASRPER